MQYPIWSSIVRSAGTLWASTAEKTVVEGILKAKLAKRDDYDRDCELRNDLFHGRQVDITWAFLTKYFPLTSSIQSPDGSYQLQPILYPLVKKVIYHLANTFLRPPSYRWIKQDGDYLEGDALEKQTQAWTYWTNQCGFDRALQKAEEAVWLYDAVFLSPAFRNGTLDLDVLRPSLVHAIEGKIRPWDIGDSPCICVPVKAGAMTTNILTAEPISYERWEHEGDAWRYALVDSSGVELDGGRFSDGANPYKLQPFVVWHNDAEGRLYPDMDETLVQLSIALNLILSDTQHALRLANYGQAYIKTDDVNINTANTPRGPNVTWILSKTADVGTISGTVNAYELANWVKEFYRQVASGYNIPYEVFESTQSALGQLMQRWDSTLTRLKWESTRVKGVQDLYPVMSRVVNNHSGILQLDESLRLECTPGMIPQPQNVLQEAQAAELGFKLCIDNPISWLMRRDGLSEEKATMIANKNFETNRRLGVLQSSPPVQKTDPTEVSINGRTGVTP